MGQYWDVVNLDKKEFIHAHKLGNGLKLWEQVASSVGTSTALLILIAAMPESRGGGDLDLRDDLPPEYLEIAKRTIGRWAGDRIAMVGDYAEDSDLPNSPIPASKIASLCGGDGPDSFKDISEDVCRVIEHELDGKFIGEGWRYFKYNQPQQAEHE